MGAPLSGLPLPAIAPIATVSSAAGQHFLTWDLTLPSQLQILLLLPPNKGPLLNQACQSLRPPPVPLQPTVMAAIMLSGPHLCTTLDVHRTGVGTEGA